MMKRSAWLLIGTVLLCMTGPAEAQKSAGEHVDDSATTARVKVALLEQSISDAADINVETSKGVVQLAGWVDSGEIKVQAGRIASETEGVAALSNRLQIRSGKRSAGTALDDTILAAKVKLELAKSDGTNVLKVNVEVRSAVVELSGFVNTYEERDAALSLVAAVDGVGELINSIDVTR